MAQHHMCLPHARTERADGLQVSELEAQLGQAFAGTPLPEDRDRKAVREFLVRLPLVLRDELHWVSAYLANPRLRPPGPLGRGPPL